MANKNLILEEILKKYNENSEKGSDSDANFELFAAEQLLKDKNLDQEEIESGLLGASNDNGIDGFFIFLDNELITEINEVDQSKMYNNLIIHFHQYKNQYKIKEDVVLKFNNAFKDIFNFENETLSGWNETLKDRIILARKVILKTGVSGANIKFIINHVSKSYSEDIKGNESYWSKVENLKSTISQAGISKLEVKYNFIGGEELKELSYKKPDYSLELLLKDSPLTLEFGESHIGYIALVSLKNYFKFIIDEDKNLRRHLFDSNVRDYQNKTAVNSEIENTIKQDNDIDFWWLNNGVTVIASNESSQIGKKLLLKNVQIVNGLQTSYSIYNSIKNENISDERSIFIKIIICDDKNIIDKIIRATNSQNAISSSLLRSTDSIQRDIEQYFKSKGYFYDRRKNYYRNQGMPRNKIISINLLSQCVVSLVLNEKNPSRARSNPTILTKTDADYKKIYGSNIDFKVYFNSVLIYKKVEQELKEYTAENDFSDDPVSDSLVKLFKFHISRTLISVITNNANPAPKDLENLDIDQSVTKESVVSSISILRNIILEYQKQDKQSSSIDNISKQTEFSKFITREISRHI